MRKMLCVLLSICLLATVNPVANAAVIDPVEPAIPNDSMHYTTEICPYGSPSDYDDRVDVVRVPNVPLQDELNEMTDQALLDLLEEHLPGYGDVVSTLVDIIKALPDTEPGSERGLSFVAYHYQHSELGYYVDNSLGRRLGVEKIVMYCYSELNYQGPTSAYVYYDCVAHY